MNLIFEDKINHLTAWRSSGLTQRQYCELHNLNYNTFKSWGQLLKKSLSHSKTSTTISEPKPETKENPVTASSNQIPCGLIPVVVSPQVSVDKGRPEKSTSHSPELESSTERVRPSKLESALTLPTLSEAKPPPPEVSLILISGLQIKCDVRLLAQVLEVVEHV